MNAGKISAIVVLLFFPFLQHLAQAKYSGGSGSPNDPYRIASAIDLASIPSHTEDFNKCFILTADVNVSQYQFSIGSTVVNFTGVFNGNGHSISNFKYSKSGDDAGLFSLVTGAGSKITNVILINPDVSGDTAVGSLVGYLNSGTIENCFVRDAVVSGTNYIGGLLGFNSSGKIINCSTSGTVTGVSYVGGLVGTSLYNNNQIRKCCSSCAVTGTADHIGGLAGSCWNITKSCSTGTVHGKDFVGGLAGLSEVGQSFSSADVNASGSYVGGLVGRCSIITDCYACGSVRGVSFVGGLAGDCPDSSDTITRAYSTALVTGTGTYIGGLVGWVTDSASVKYGYWDINTSGLSISPAGFGRTTYQMKSTLTFAGWGFEQPVWNIQEGIDYPHLLWEGLAGQVMPTNWYGGGTGIFNDPYLISKLEHFAALCLILDDWNRYFKLVTDINYEQFNYFSFTPIGSSDYPFSGVFDGNGHSISNFKYSTSADFAGLFGYGTYCSIKNIILIDPNVSGKSYVGALIGGLTDGRIENCSARNALISGLNYIGGLAGYCRNVSQSFSTGTVRGTSGVGGLLGACASATNCFSTADVNGTGSYIGGLVGSSYLNGLIVTDCFARGSVKRGNYVGGLVGHFYNGSNSVTKTFSTGLVTGKSSLGGLIGYIPNTSNVKDSFWDINTSGQTTSSGGADRTTAQMKTLSTFTSAGWDFNDIWAICETTNYPKLLWQIPHADIVCPDGVDFEDLAELCGQWLFEELSADLVPPGGDGIVNFADFSAFASQWTVNNDVYDLLSFTKQWLKVGLANCSADIWPLPYGDGIVNFTDLALMCNFWLEGL
jgi:hypothetical protein